MARRVLVGHLDCALGGRLAKSLYQDPEVSLVLGVGSAPAPGFLDAYRDKIVWQRLDLAKPRHLVNFFASERFARARLDSVILLPFAEDRAQGRIPGGVPTLVAEARRLLDACARDPGIRRFAFLSSGFVYRPEPGCANLLDEDQELSFDSEEGSPVRGWINADLACQSRLQDPELGITILRSAAIATESGEFLNCPPLSGGAPPLGFNPVLQVVSERDVARALLLALHADRPGIFNIAGRELFALSELRPRGGGAIGPIPVPDLLSGAVTLVDQALGLARGRGARLLRYGIVLDTSRAEHVLGFEPHYRLELRPGPRPRLEAVRCH